jgi:hypothetical protein
MRLNPLRVCMHADFHRKSFAQTAIPDSRADNSGFASNRRARSCASRQTIAANGKILPGEWQYGTECMRDPIENHAVGMRRIERLGEY